MKNKITKKTAVKICSAWHNCNNEKKIRNETSPYNKELQVPVVYTKNSQVQLDFCTIFF